MSLFFPSPRSSMDMVLGDQGSKSVTSSFQLLGLAPGFEKKIRNCHGLKFEVRQHPTFQQMLIGISEASRISTEKSLRPMAMRP